MSWVDCRWHPADDINLRQLQRFTVIETNKDYTIGGDRRAWILKVWVALDAFFLLSRGLRLEHTTFSAECFNYSAKFGYCYDTLWVKKNHATLHSCITLTYVDRSSKFFHCWIQQVISNKTLVIFPTTPYICRYITLGDVNVLIISFSGSMLVQKSIQKFEFLVNCYLVFRANVFVRAFERKDTLRI